MDRLVQVQENEVRIDFEVGCKCRTTIHLKSLIDTMPVAFKVQTSTPDKFLVKPPNGFISPLGDFSFEIILKPRKDLPEEFPRSKDRFLIKTALAPDCKMDGNDFPDKVPNDWFASRKKQVFVDAKLKVVYIGGFLLRHLVAKGDVDSVKQILKRHNCCNHADDEGRTALQIASASGSFGMLKTLLNAEARVDLASMMEQSPLLEAVYMGHLEIIKELLDKGADTEARNPKGWTAIHLAATWNRTDMLSLLIEKGADLEAKDKEGRTALHSAATKGHQDCVKLLLEAGADKDARSKDGRTAIFRAAANGYPEIVDSLLDAGADSHIRALNGETPYDAALEKGHTAVLEILELGNELLTAARRGDLQTVVSSLTKGARVNRCDQYGWTALHCAAFKGHINIMQKLIEYGADIGFEDTEGHTALHCAVEGGKKEAVQFLLGKGAEVNVKTSRGATPLYMSAAMGYPGISRLLLNRGADTACLHRKHPIGTTDSQDYKQKKVSFEIR